MFLFRFYILICFIFSLLVAGIRQFLSASLLTPHTPCPYRWSAHNNISIVSLIWSVRPYSISRKALIRGDSVELSFQFSWILIRNINILLSVSFSQYKEFGFLFIVQLETLWRLLLPIFWFMSFVILFTVTR